LCKSLVCLDVCNILTYTSGQTLSKRVACPPQLTAADCSRLSSLGVIPGANLHSVDANPWLGSDGPYTATFTNRSGKHIILVVWQVNKRWIIAQQAAITVSLDADASITISLPTNWAGGFAGLYPKTVLTQGAIKNTLGEIALAYPSPTFDIDRTVDMSGNRMTITSSSGGCVADMTHCAFVCTKSGANSCQNTGVDLLSCPGKDIDLNGYPSGGCLWGGSLQVQMLA
jgi:hypothetical protein